MPNVGPTERRCVNILQTAVDGTGLEIGMTTSKRTITSVCVLLLALTCSILAVRSGHARAQADERYETVATRNVMVAARDGVRLATDVYVPGHGGTTPGRFPTVVERTPYNKDSAEDQLPKYFVPR